ncbi:hypothetical protein ACOSQ3_029202 [Xanthoceras sorbifolium]
MSELRGKLELPNEFPVAVLHILNIRGNVISIFDRKSATITPPNDIILSILDPPSMYAEDSLDNIPMQDQRQFINVSFPINQIITHSLLQVDVLERDDSMFLKLVNA